ncbi:TPA: hypothetical protein U2J22_001340 [Citrobacter youngae]|nr:hypothetical protein [Citrobacter youngae]
MESEFRFFEPIGNFREEFFSLLQVAMKDGLKKVSDAVSSKKYIGTYYNWPSLSFKKNGLPSFSSSIFQGANEYRKLFGTQNQAIIESDIKSFNTFLKFVTSHTDLENRLVMESLRKTNDENIKGFKEIVIYSIINDVIERYIHLHGTFEYDEDKANNIINEKQNSIFLDTLPIDIVVPILFIDFDFDSFFLSDGVEIRRLSEKEHLARYNIKSYNISVHDSVLSSATHALVLHGWEVKNSACIMDFNTLYNTRAYPIDIIDKFFASIRLIKNVNTGYAQVLSLSKSWFNHCKADLPHMIGTTIRSYPTTFEDYYWNIDSIPLTSKDEIDSIGKTFRSLCTSKENSIDLSVKRLNQCLVRDSEEDSVLDATIALEALLSDDGNQEMTHKLAMRVGALANLDRNFGKSPQQAFKDIKSIYAYRSAIVHGSKTLDKKRVIKIDDNKETTTHSLSVEYVRFVLKTLLENPQYRDPRVIDSELLLGPITN